MGTIFSGRVPLWFHFKSHSILAIPSSFLIITCRHHPTAPGPSQCVLSSFYCVYITFRLSLKYLIHQTIYTTNIYNLVTSHIHLEISQHVTFIVLLFFHSSLNIFLLNFFNRNRYSSSLVSAVQDHTSK